jgi:hypothetical protein
MVGNIAFSEVPSSQRVMAPTEAPRLIARMEFSIVPVPRVVSSGQARDNLRAQTGLMRRHHQLQKTAVNGGMPSPARHFKGISRINQPSSEKRSLLICSVSTITAIRSPFSESGRFPPPADAENQPLDSSARNLLIYRAPRWAFADFRPLPKSDAGARKRQERVKMGVFGRPDAGAKSAGICMNPRR